MEGRKGPWISWPAHPPADGGRKWINQVAIKNKAVKDAIEKTLTDRYQKSGDDSDYE
jgi:DNA-binding cell septation regulator SpoVG